METMSKIPIDLWIIEKQVYTIIAFELKWIKYNQIWIRFYLATKKKPIIFHTFTLKHFVIFLAIYSITPNPFDTLVDCGIVFI